MKPIILSLTAFLLTGGRLMSAAVDGDRPLSVQQLRDLGGADHWGGCTDNPVLRPGAKGQWDAGALGSMSVLKVGEMLHMYYEAWGVRGNSAIDYNTIQIGHATARDGLHGTKDPANPVLPNGARTARDRAGKKEPAIRASQGRLLVNGCEFMDAGKPAIHLEKGLAAAAICGCAFPSDAAIINESGSDVQSGLNITAHF